MKHCIAELQRVEITRIVVASTTVKIFINLNGDDIGGRLRLFTKAELFTFEQLGGPKSN